MSSGVERALDASEYICQGLWVNWSKGRVLGPTITLSPASATLLTNLLALFVTIAGGQAWTIVRFTLHQLRTLAAHSTISAEYHKEQVVLRNTTSAITAAQLLIYLGWSSREHTVKLTRKPTITPIIMLAIITATFFLVAGAFNNIVTDAGPMVLSKSPHCGFFNQTYENIVYTVETTSPETFELFDESLAKRTQNVELSLQYAQSCYLMQGTGSSDCNTFRQSSLELLMSKNGTCPFESNLGINAPERDRITFRKVTSCTVLNDTSHTTGWISQSKQSRTQPSWRVAYANYEPNLLYSEEETYSYSDSSEFDTEFAVQFSLPYQLGQTNAMAPAINPSQSTFKTIAELKQDKADLELLYLSFTGTYMEPIDDPWFAAHQIAHINTTVPFLETTYARDRPFSTVACTEQYEICTNPTDCTPLLGFDQVQENMAANTNLSPTQNITLDRILNAAGGSWIMEITQCLTSVSAPFLAIGKSLKGRKKTVSLPLPENQWELELQYWHSIGMAQMQRLVVEYGTGQISPQLKYLLPPETESQKWICQNLIIRSTVYSSFSVLALNLIIVGGLLIVALSLTIEPLTAWASRKFGRWGHARETWIDHDMLGDQLWRLNMKKQVPDCHEASVTGARNDHLTSFSRASTLADACDEKRMRRASSQALSLEDHERLMIARAHGSWV